jgi:hypothetical protein
LQVNYRKLPGGAAQQVQKHEPPKDHQFLSPNQTLAFKDAPVLSWGPKHLNLSTTTRSGFFMNRMPKDISSDANGGPSENPKKPSRSARRAPCRWTLNR